MVAYRPRVIDGNDSKQSRIGPSKKQSNQNKDLEIKSNTNGRTIKWESGPVQHANGSMEVRIGNTVVLCTIIGPKSIRRSVEINEKGIVKCFVKLAPFSMYEKGESLQPTNRNETWEQEDFRIKREQYLSRTLLDGIKASIITDYFPKAILEIHAMVLCDDGGVEAALISCASMALADGGIALYDLTPCVTVAYIQPSGSQTRGSLIFDPDQSTLSQYTGVSTLCFALMPSSENVTALNILGSIPFDITGEAVSMCFAGCVRMHQHMQQHLIVEARSKLEINE